MMNIQPTTQAPIASGSPERFGYEWHVYSEMRPEYEGQFRRWIPQLGVDDWKGRTFLDVGCGMGRNSYWPMTYGAAGGCAVDVDERSLCVARRTLSRYPSVRVEERSAYELGFENQFDVVFSIGVIHHLEFPERALAQMVRAARPGGRVIIWVYGLENNGWIVRVLDPLRRALFSRLPIEIVHHLSLYAAALLWVTLRLGFGRIEYFQLARRLKFPQLRSIVFDQMLPKIAHYWPRQTVADLMQKAGLTSIELRWVNEMSWSAAGMKPDNDTRDRRMTGACSQPTRHPLMLDLLRCPATHQLLAQRGDQLCTIGDNTCYQISSYGVPIFARQLSDDSSAQRGHYDAIADAYVRNLSYPHTQEYMAYLDRVLLDAIDPARLDTIAELCCGHGEAFKLLRGRFKRGVGVDISESMLNYAVRSHGTSNVTFVQGDVTRLPLASDAFDSVLMLGGIHHVNNRASLFGEINRILKPGGRFYFREPANDFVLWRSLRALIYRLSPMLDHETERPLRWAETVRELKNAALACEQYDTHGLLGFCLFMNSDVLVFNRAFRYVPGIRQITRLAARIDEKILNLPGLSSAGLQVVGVAEKSAK
jgi:SAM-dependent methyltransferase